MIDKRIVENIFHNLDGYLEQLHRLAALEPDAFMDDPLMTGAAKYYLQVAIESCIDLANHFIARQGYRAPQSYADSFTILAENHIVPEDFLPTLQKMARMRNRLVHLYWEIDADILYMTLQNHLDDFTRFEKYIYDSIRQ